MNKQEPISEIVTKAKLDMGVAVSQIQQKYALPNFLLELIVSNVLSEVRECVNKDYIFDKMKASETEEKEKSKLDAAE